MTSGSTSHSNDAFNTTNWSMVLEAIEGDERAQRTLAQILTTCWYPCFAFLRRKGFSSHDAEDATQQFFAWLLEKQVIERADPARGRFRSFLIVESQCSLNRRKQRAGALFP